MVLLVLLVLLNISGCIIRPLLDRRERRRQSLMPLLLNWIVQRLDCHGVFAFAPFVICFARVAFFSFSLWCHTLAGVPTYRYAFNSKTPTMTAAVAVPMSTYECCCCSCYCTYDLHHSPPWLLLLLFVVDRLVSVTLCCSFVIAIN